MEAGYASTRNLGYRCTICPSKPEVGAVVGEHRLAGEEEGHRQEEVEEAQIRTAVVEAAGDCQQRHRSGREDQDQEEDRREVEVRHSQEHRMRREHPYQRSGRSRSHRSHNRHQPQEH